MIKSTYGDTKMECTLGIGDAEIRADFACIALAMIHHGFTPEELEEIIKDAYETNERDKSKSESQLTRELVEGIVEIIKKATGKEDHDEL